MAVKLPKQWVYDIDILNKQIRCVIFSCVVLWHFGDGIELPKSNMIYFLLYFASAEECVLDAWKMLSYKFMSLTICLHLHMFWETLVCSVSLFRKNKKFHHHLVYMVHCGLSVLFFI